MQMYGYMYEVMHACMCMCECGYVGVWVFGCVGVCGSVDLWVFG